MFGFCKNFSEEFDSVPCLFSTIFCIKIMRHWSCIQVFFPFVTAVLSFLRNCCNLFVFKRVLFRKTFRIASFLASMSGESSFLLAGNHPGCGSGSTGMLDVTFVILSAGLVYVKSVLYWIFFNTSSQKVILFWGLFSIE